jgi:GDPmannose 4,6-dehydratase
MAAHLLHKQTRNATYVVHGVCRKNSINLPILQELSKKLRQNTRLILHFGDVTDPFFMLNLLKETSPDEVYNFAA